MKKIISVILVLSVSLLAMNVSKNHNIKNLSKKYQKRFSIMKEEKVCISNVKSKGGLKVCKKNTINNFKELMNF